MRFAFPAILLVSILTACSSTPKEREPAELRDFKPAAKVEMRWDRRVGDMGYGGLQPAVTADAVYAANSEGELYSFDPLKGKKLWKVDTGFSISGGVGAGEGLIVVGGLKSEVAAFNREGKLVWQTRVSSEVLSAPLIAEGVVVIRSSDGRIAGLSLSDGNRKWLYERSTPALVVRNHAGVAILRGVVYAGFAAGRLVAINLSNGNLLWESPVSQPRGNTELDRISDITSSPVADGERVCAVSFQGRIACLEARQGAVQWSREVSSDKGLRMSGNHLYVTDSEGTVMALDKLNGSTIWKNDQLALRKVSAPYVTDRYVIVGDFEGYVHVLSREDGSIVAREKTHSSPIPYAPVPLGRGLVLQTQDGGIFSIDVF